jgi:hypothetical protein
MHTCEHTYVRTCAYMRTCIHAHILTTPIPGYRYTHVHAYIHIMYRHVIRPCTQTFIFFITVTQSFSVWLSTHQWHPGRGGGGGDWTGPQAVGSINVDQTSFLVSASKYVAKPKSTPTLPQPDTTTTTAAAKTSSLGQTRADTRGWSKEAELDMQLKHWHKTR